jgi:ribosomal protein S18 acetylase RimI-like enzyme
MSEPTYRIVRAADVEPAALRAYVREAWHGEVVIAHGDAYRPAEQDGFVALDAERIAGHASYRLQDGGAELTAIVVAPRHEGIGSRLLERVVEVARAHGCARLVVTTTNDNVDALRFYQRRGFRLVAVRAGAVDEARVMKPEIPEIGSYGIPMRDEIDLELDLAGLRR